MSRTFCAILAFTLVTAAAARAQQQTRPATPAAAQAPGTTQQKPGMTAQQNPPARPEPPAQAVNIKLDMTITDQAGPGQPATRSVTMIVADRMNGSIRSTGNQVQARMFVDATPRMLPNGNVQVMLGLEYNPRQDMGAKPPSGPEFPGPSSTGGSSLNQRITLILEPGKPLIISQAADPVSDRKITVEVRATLLK
jgi:hypothetical protein